MPDNSPGGLAVVGIGVQDGVGVTDDDAEAALLTAPNEELLARVD